jgi:hypothetical protein
MSQFNPSYSEVWGRQQEFRMVATTFQPFEENSLAVARPRPEELPVMKIVF